MGSLGSVLAPGGRLLVLCFSENEPGDWGPRRVTQREIRESFGDGWKVEEIAAATLRTTREDPEVAAWMARIRRL